ncbi:hypothetical protein PC114_g3044 [Phytophthora cactorum]|nr:hypothetical protein PC112_g1450 [Phytophthora cactorum]KAG2928603.1 hypothetical protein PC114_g3044 [Phytophthora cactorum]KAG3189125.1 hypothetical protein C6341_g2404 [Phytophthora cactorum]
MLSGDLSELADAVGCRYGGKCSNGLTESTKLRLARNAHSRELSVVAADDIEAGEVLGQYLGELEHVSVSRTNRPRNEGYRFVKTQWLERPSHLFAFSLARRTSAGSCTSSTIRAYRWQCSTKWQMDVERLLWLLLPKMYAAKKRSPSTTAMIPGLCIAAVSTVGATAPSMTSVARNQVDVAGVSRDLKHRYAAVQMAKLTGSTNYKLQEVRRLLVLVCKYPPLGKNEWERFASANNTNRGRGVAEHDYESLCPPAALKQTSLASLPSGAATAAIRTGSPSVGRIRDQKEARRYPKLTNASNRLGRFNLTELRETIGRKRSNEDDDELLEASYVKAKRLRTATAATVLKKRLSDLENISGTMDSNIHEVIMMRREENERRAESHRTEEEQRRRDELAAREARYLADKAEAKERRRQEKMEKCASRDKEEARQRTQ